MDSPRQRSDRDQKYADKDAAKNAKRKAEFKANKKKSNGKLRDKKFYSAKIAMYSASLAAITGDTIFVQPYGAGL